MKFKEQVDIIASQGMRVTDRRIAEVALIYYGAILFNRYDRFKDIQYIKNHVQMYCMMFGSSSIGKDFTLDNVRDAMGLSSDDYSNQMMTVFEVLSNIQGIPADPEIIRFIPTSTCVSLDGTKEGLFDTANAVNESNFGSISLYSSEFLGLVTSSKEMLETLKTAYDGVFQKKVIKGNTGDAKRHDVKGVVVNMMGAGSKDSVDNETQKALKQLAQTGLYRRSLVIDIPHSEIILREDGTQMPMDDLIQHYKDLDSRHRDDYNDRIDEFSKTGELSKVFEIELNARAYIKDMNKALIDRANEDQLNGYKQLDSGSLKVIVDTGYIIAYIEGCDKVKKEHLKEAWRIFVESRETTYETFREIRPHNEIYQLLKKKDNMTHSDILYYSSCDCIPKGKPAFKDTMELVGELAYRADKQLVVGSGQVVRYAIKDLPLTNMDELIFSISTDRKREKATAFEQVTFAWDDLPALAKSHPREELDEHGEMVQLGIESFTCCHYNESKTSEPYGHRGKDYFIQGQNVIAFDLDSGVTTIEFVKNMMANYKFLIYTTKSHNSSKYNYADRFRIIIPTKSMYYVNPEQHKQMYKNVADYFQLDIDNACRNVSRLLFSNKDAEIFSNDGDPFDVSPFLPDTDSSENLLKSILNYKTDASYILPDSGTLNETEVRIAGEERWAIANINIGNLRTTLYSVWSFVMDLTGDKARAEQSIRLVQEKRKFPLKFVEEILYNHGSK